MNELMIPLQNHTGKALYTQIYEYIKNEIADGKISRGEKLPSTRLLSKNLQISRSTVELAYEQLLSEGYIESQPYRGYFACDITELYQMMDRSSRIQPERKTETEPGAKQGESEIQIDFSPYAVDLSVFPYNAWRKANRTVLQKSENFFTAGNARGEWRLRSEITRYLHQARGVNCTPEQVVVGAGNEYLLLLLAQILGEDRRVVMESPTYLRAYRTLSNMNYKIKEARMDESGISIEEIRRLNPDVVYTMPSHQFPLGTVMTMKRRLELLKWAMEAEERYIIEDDHDSEFRYKGKPIPALQSSDVGGRVIYIGTFSKSIASALRVSYMVLPQKLVAEYEKKCGFYSTTVATYQQEVLAEFMENGDFERHLNRMRGTYKGKHDFLTSMLKREPWVYKIYGDNAGLHVLVEVDTVFSEEELVKRLAACGVKLYGLSEHFIHREQAQTFGENGRYRTFLFGFGRLSQEEITEGIRRIREVL